MSDPSIKLRESTATLVGDTRVGCGSIWERDYTLPDGTVATGLTARLAPLDDDDAVVVGEGSVLELGGRRWRVTAVAAGRPGSVELRPAELAAHAGGLDTGPGGDLVGATRRALASGRPHHFEDRLPIDHLERRYDEATRVDPATADRLSRAIAEAADTPDAAVASQAVVFFERRPRAAGGDRLGELVAAYPERFSTEPDPRVLGREIGYRGRAIRTALAWGGPEVEPPPALVELAKQEALDGRGASLIGHLLVYDRAWVSQHRAALLSRNPDALGEHYDVLRALGAVAADAVDALLGDDVSDAGRRSLYYAVRFDPELEDEERRALIARTKPG